MYGKCIQEVLLPGYTATKASHAKAKVQVQTARKSVADFIKSAIQKVATSVAIVKDVSNIYNTCM